MGNKSWHKYINKSTILKGVITTSGVIPLAVTRQTKIKHLYTVIMTV